MPVAEVGLWWFADWLFLCGMPKQLTLPDYQQLAETALASSKQAELPSGPNGAVLPGMSISVEKFPPPGAHSTAPTQMVVKCPPGAGDGGTAEAADMNMQMNSPAVRGEILEDPISVTAPS